MRDLRGSEETGRCIGTGRNAGTATDTLRRIHRLIRDRLGDGHLVGLRGASRSDRDVAAGLDDPVKGGPVDHEVLHDGKATRSPRLEPELVAVLELPHVKLTDGRQLLRTMRYAVDDQSAAAADSLAAVVVEGNR